MSVGEDITETAPPQEHDNLLEDWPLRPWLLAALGAVAGLAIWFLLEDWDDESPARMAAVAFIFFSSASIAFTLTLHRTIESIAFSVILGIVMGGVAFLVLDAGERLAGEEYALGAGVFFSILAIPLFQAGFHRTRFATPYRETHFHVWTDAVSAGGAIAFVLLSWLLLWLLHGLFSLIGIEVIEELIETGWFPGMFMGATFGMAMGVLRNQLGVIGTLQRVVMLVFALLAVPFAAALLIFLVILLFSGGTALWEATDSATPVLLSCAVGAFILCNAVVRDDDDARSDNVVMLAAAMVLAACILPLAVFAAISMGIRIDQHGLAPARIWALIAIAIACAYGLAYWVGLVRGRVEAWAHYLRRANLHLAAVSCVIAFLLSLPLLDFGAISARDQIARLESGAVTPEEFDYSALRWDFGDAGREALATLVENENADIAQYAQEAQDEEHRRYRTASVAERQEAAERLTADGIDEPAAEAIRAFLRREIYICMDGCRAMYLRDTERGALFALIQHSGYGNPRLLLVPEGADIAVEQMVNNGRLADNLAASEETLDEDSTIELRPFEGYQIYVDGEPASQPFE